MRRILWENGHDSLEDNERFEVLLFPCHTIRECALIHLL